MAHAGGDLQHWVMTQHAALDLCGVVALANHLVHEIYDNKVPIIAEMHAHLDGSDWRRQLQAAAHHLLRPHYVEARAPKQQAAQECHVPFCHIQGCTGGCRHPEVGRDQAVPEGSSCEAYGYEVSK